jgi:hypothetical protein
MGEIGFFDHDIIPMAGQLSEYGVFGVSRDEYLNYAKKNSKWQNGGQHLVADMLQRIRSTANASKLIFHNDL